MISIFHKHIGSGGSSAMCTYGEGKINESYETHLVAGFCFRLSPPGSMGLTGLQCSVLCVVWISLLSQHEHKSVSLYLYQSSLSSYYIVCREWFFFFGTQGGHVRGAEADAFVCFISLELGFFWSYREEEWVLSCCKDSHRCNRQVGSGNRRHSPQSLVESESKDETDSSTLGAHFHRTLIHTAVEQIHLSTTLHEFEMVVEWTRESCWGKDSPAGSMQRGNWSSFWGENLLLLWRADG